MRRFERQKNTILVLVSAIHGAASDDMTQPALPLRSGMNFRLPLQLSASGESSYLQFWEFDNLDSKRFYLKLKLLRSFLKLLIAQ